MDIKTPLRARIRVFAAHYGMSDSAFGFWAANDRKILCRIAEGRVTLKTCERIDIAMTARIIGDNLTWEGLLSSRERDNSTGGEDGDVTGCPETASSRTSGGLLRAEATP